ncbi:MAG: RHS repeat-associated core domain-containing protein [Candidatus Sumerlaeia bacterium]|nr:RHS repeat-associated core domain-containing protein [Candidatus Sumerlaeia bacterium]
MRWDAEVELYYMRNRWYDPYLGRFLTRDPIGAFGDPLNFGNAYTFPANNPWSYRDPWGLMGTGCATVVTWRNVAISIDNLEWHHMFPKQLFNHPGISPSIRKFFNDPEWGYIMPKDMHRGKNIGLHQAGWNKDWEDWLTRTQGRVGAGNITLDMVRTQRNHMVGLPQYSAFFEKKPSVFRAHVSYTEWRSGGRKKAILAFGRTAGRVGGRAIPIVGVLLIADDAMAGLAVGGVSEAIYRGSGAADIQGLINSAIESARTPVDSHLSRFGKWLLGGENLRKSRIDDCLTD